VRERCLEYFLQLDGFIAEIVAMAGPESRVLIASDHGFGPTTEVFHVNAWLHERGYLAWSEGAAAEDGTRLAAPRLKTHASMLDWPRTTAYAVTPSGNGIVIRVAGQGRAGGIAPETYGSFRQRLAEELLEYRDPENGRPVVTRVRTREEAYPGDGAHAAPDLLLTLRDGGFVSVLDADRPVLQRPVPSGTHRPEGILLCRGPGIRVGASIDPVSIVDVAPTLLHSLGLAVPADLDGEVAKDIFEPEWLAAHPIRTTTALEPEREAACDGDEPFDDTPVLERLRALGYIE
jgi:predicted AlkP superfamily phosphohydrolase/phosphomutase